jgi:hypothetical protein
MKGAEGIEDVEGVECQSITEGKCSCYTANNL